MPAKKVVIGNRGDANEATVLGGGLVVADAHDYHEYDGSRFHLVHASSTAAATQGIHIVTPGAAYACHLVYQVSPARGGRLYLHEGPTLGATGAALTAYCANREVAATANMEYYWNTPLTATGTLLEQSVAHDASGFVNANSVGGHAGWWLAPNTIYLLQFGFGATADVAVFDLDAYEMVP